jgi:hypothetical protein
MDKELIGIIGTISGVAVGSIGTYFVTRAQLKHEEKLASRRHREQIIKEKAEETYSTIQEIMDVAHSIQREVGVFLTDVRWTNEQIQTTYSRLLNPINKLRLLLYLYFPTLANTEVDSIASAYDLVEALRGYAVQYIDITIGDEQISGRHIAQTSGQALDYHMFLDRYTKNIEMLNKFLDKFANDVSKVLAPDNFN